jgi:hypothetical protein
MMGIKLKNGIMKRLNLIIIITVSLTTNMYLLAQETIDKEIVVVKPYEPVLSDAHKINLLPGINDTTTIKPTFTYIISPRKYETEYEIKPIKAATLKAESLDKLYKTYLKLGVGNYFVPLVEVNINSLRSRDKWLGIYLKHNSINGKIRLDEDIKVNPGYNDNIALIEAKKIFKKSVLSGYVSPEFLGLNFYGYNPLLGEINIDKDSLKQNYFYTNAGIRMASAYKDSLHLNYDAAFQYGYTKDHYDNNEHAFRLSAELNKHFRNQVFGMGAGFSHYLSPETLDSVNNTVIRFEPWFSRSSTEFTYKLGLDLTTDIYGDDAHFYIYPIAFMQIKVLDKIMIPYFGVNGRLEQNHFGKITRENMYLMPGLSTRNTHHKINAFIGIKGNYYSKLSYHLNFNYDIADDMYFFINDTVDILGNKFLVEYDDIERINLMGEMIFTPLDKLSFALKGNYYHYRLDSLEYAWHKPTTEISLFTTYNLKDKFLFEGNLFYIGNRYARAVSGEPVKLSGYTDLSLGVEYRYSKVLSAFIRLNNILGMKQETWMYYPGMRFNMLLGFTYSL